MNIVMSAKMPPTATTFELFEFNFNMMLVTIFGDNFRYEILISSSFSQSQPPPPLSFPRSSFVFRSLVLLLPLTLCRSRRFAYVHRALKQIDSTESGPEIWKNEISSYSNCDAIAKWHKQQRRKDGRPNVVVTAKLTKSQTHQINFH